MSDVHFTRQEIFFTFTETKKGIDISTLPKPAMLNASGPTSEVSSFLFIRSIVVDGQAARLGILANDVIRSINGSEIRSLPGEINER